MKQDDKYLLIAATGNQGKVKEIKAVLADLPFCLKTAAEVGFTDEVAEDGLSFAANALKKAQAVHRHCPQAYVLADDSGLCIDALGGAPGLYSARFGGVETGYKDKFALLYDLLKEVDPADRTARFLCAIAVVRPDGSYFTTQGLFEGRIADRPAGQGGFGYDPIFFVPAYQKTSAELTAAEKNACSHRGKALAKAVARLQLELPFDH